MESGFGEGWEGGARLTLQGQCLGLLVVNSGDESSVREAAQVACPPGSWETLSPRAELPTGPLPSKPLPSSTQSPPEPLPRAGMGGARGLAGTSKAKLHLPEAVLHRSWHRAYPPALMVNCLPFSDFNTLFIKPKIFRGKVNT